jgi:hypothetical protein
VFGDEEEEDWKREEFDVRHCAGGGQSVPIFGGVGQPCTRPISCF